MKNKALFLDRDGVINVEKNYVHRIEDFEFIDGVFETLRYFQDQGYFLVIITNQAGIGRGYYTEENFHILNNWMIEQFRINQIVIKKVYFCPYHPTYGVGRYKQESWDRKPNPGMVLLALEEFDLDPQQCILVGDKMSDVEAGLAAKIGMNFLLIDRDITLPNTKFQTIQSLTQLKNKLYR